MSESDSSAQPIGAAEPGADAASLDRAALQARIAHLEQALTQEAARHQQREQALLATLGTLPDVIAHLVALQAIDQAILASHDLSRTLEVVYDQVMAQLGVDAVGVLVLDEATQMLTYGGGRGFRSPAIMQSRLRLGEDHAGRALLERRPISLADPAAPGTGLLRAPLIAGEEFVSYVALPLISNGAPHGVLELFHRSPLRLTSEWHVTARLLAAQTAVAVATARLFAGLQQANQELVSAYDATIEGWSRALDLRDKETEGHSQRVTEVTVRLARAVGMSEAELVHVRRGALLHDIGKMGVPDHILLKPGPLTEDEWVIMRQHPVYAQQLLGPITFLGLALEIPIYHHEKWDGTGYPHGLAGAAIPLAARLFAIVDVWDALCSDRPYRPAWPVARVREHLRAQAGSHFDPEVAQRFLEVWEHDDLSSGRNR